jgi:hypothetical protein
MCVHCAKDQARWITSDPLAGLAKPGPGQVQAVHKVNASTFARMAGNIMGGLLADPNVTVHDGDRRTHLVTLSVDLAEAIVAEVERRAK